MSHRRSPDRRPRGKSLGAVTVVVAALSTSCGEVPPPVPPGFVPAGNLSSTLAGHWPKTEDFENMLFRLHKAEIDMDSGKVTWDRFFAADLVDCGRDRVHDSAVHPSPTYMEQFRSPEEVDSYIEGAKRIRGGIEPSEAQIEEYRSRPRVWYRPRLRLDDWGRLWALSTRVESDSSYLDLHARIGYVGTVQVRDGAVGFDLLGSTLVVFVNRPSTPDDPAGIPRRGIDWYDISELPFDP